MNKRIIDRIEFAAELSQGKRVLDLGGKGGGIECAPATLSSMYGKLVNFGARKGKPIPSELRFPTIYKNISARAADYKVVDCKAQPGVDYVINFDEPGAMKQLGNIIANYSPEIILCMETLEHVGHSRALMDEMARSVENGTEVFITLPNNGNWVLNALGWGRSHLVAFLRSNANCFIRQSNLGRYEVVEYECIGRYSRLWRLVYLVSGFQPFSWGFHIKKTIQPKPGQPPKTGP